MSRPDDDTLWAEMDPELDGGPDPELADLLGGVTTTVDRELAGANVPWDFAAVLARAHALDPEQFPRELVREAELAEPVVSLDQQRRARRVTRDDEAFAAIVADVRADAELDAALRMHGVPAGPPARAAATPEPPPSRWRRGLVGVVALAAAVLVGIGVLEGVQYVQTRMRTDGDAALHQGDRSSVPHEQAVIDDTPEATTRAPRRERPAAPVLEDAKVPAPELAAAPLEPSRTRPEPNPSRRPKVALRPESAEPSLAERLAALDGEAHAAWRAGELGTAEQKFEALIALAGSSRLADLAYGDLFTLARRRGDSKREESLWRAYLERFAHGRFADDARAGLCRRASTDAQSCWRAYLDDFPKGSYREKAVRELGESP